MPLSAKEFGDSSQTQSNGWSKSVTPIEWAFLVIGLLLSQHYAWLLDDAFVYFRYVDNFLFLNIGWVYNQGEFVEGYSSPLWLLILTALRWTEMNFWVITRLLGIVCVVILWSLLRRVNRELSPQSSLFLPLSLLLTNYAVLSYLTSGVETPLVQVAGALFALFFSGVRAPWVRGALALTPLLRHELALPLAIALGYEWYSTRRCPVGWALVGALLTGAWLVFRIMFYADIVPSTFHLKDTVDIPQGLRYIHDTFVVYHGYGVALLLLLLALDLWRRGKPLPQLLPRCAMLLTALSVIVYVVKIGGDPRHYRYLAFSYPLMVCAGAGVLEQWMSTVRLSSRWVGVAMVALMAMTLLAYPRQLSSHPIWLNEHHRTVAKINDASAHRHDREYQYASWAERTTPQVLRQLLSPSGALEYRGVFAEYRCARGYMRMGERMIHSLGLTDAILARTQMRAQRPAHKWGLVQLAREMLTIVRETGVPGPGMYRRAVEARRAPGWIERNLDAIEAIERKMYNHHSLRENLALLRERPRIQP